jgi:hypothetical protein
VFAQGEIIADAGTDEVFAHTEVLERAGLKKPLLYEAFESLNTALPNSAGGQKPRTIEDFQAYLK